MIAVPRHARSNQLQPLEARVPLLADDQVVVHGNAQRLGHLDDRLRHLDVGARRRRITRGVIMEEPTMWVTSLISLDC